MLYKQTMRGMKLPAYAPLAAFLLCVSGVTVVAVTVTLRDQKADYLSRRLGYLSVVAQLKAQNIEDFHKERLLDLEIYEKNLSLPQGYHNAFRGNTAIRRSIESHIRPLIDSGKYVSVSLVERHGRVLTTVPADAEPGEPSSNAAPTPALAGLHLSKSGQTVLDYEVELKDGTKLVFRVKNEAWFSSILQRWPGIEKTAETLIYKREGDSLLALSPFFYSKGSALKLRVPIGADIIVARAARGEPTPMLGIDYRGISCYGAVATVGGLGWLVVAKTDEADLMKLFNDRARMTVVATVAGLALVAILLIFFSRSQAERLRGEASAERLLLATAIEQAGESVVITDKAGTILYTNPAFDRATGYTREEARGKTPALLKSGRHDAAFYKSMWETLTRGGVWSGRLVNRRKDGALFEEDATITPVRDASGEISNYIAVKRDISAVKSLEDQLSHSQKMEAIGRLAGGIAHDFNNILTTINGYSEMLAETAPPDTQTAADLAEILGAGRRAALLTRQLLTFSRRAPSEPVIIDLRTSLRAVEKLLRRTLGEDIRLTLELPEEALWVRTDPGQIDQILMNMVVNARDAMPHGGTLTIRVHETDHETDQVRTLEVIPAGRYATIVVTDSGIGMDGATLSRIFEPFFTTKEKGKGTGLGLATVFGIVKQNSGHITVDSAPGQGTTFTVHLPLVPAPAQAPQAGAAAAPVSSRGDETVLVVEDQSEVLRLVTRALTPQGYHVIACGSAEQALASVRATDGPIHLLLTDVVMPGMSGDELAISLRQLRPATRVLFMSGYTDGRLDDLAGPEEKVDLLLKPFTAEQVCRRVRGALDGVAPRIA